MTQSNQNKVIPAVRYVTYLSTYLLTRQIQKYLQFWMPEAKSANGLNLESAQNIYNSIVYIVVTHVNFFIFNSLARAMAANSWRPPNEMVSKHQHMPDNSGWQI